MSTVSVGNALRGVPRTGVDYQFEVPGRPQRTFPTALLTLVAVFLSVRLSAAEVDALKPAAIQTEDVPSIPAELTARLRQYQNTRPAGFAGWSPDGKGILIRTQFANSLQLHRVYEPGGRREQITFFDEPVDGNFIPKASDGAIVLAM